MHWRTARISSRAGDAKESRGRNPRNRSSLAHSCSLHHDIRAGVPTPVLFGFSLLFFPASYQFRANVPEHDVCGLHLQLLWCKNCRRGAVAAGTAGAGDDVFRPARTPGTSSLDAWKKIFPAPSTAARHLNSCTSSFTTEYPQSLKVVLFDAVQASAASVHQGPEIGKKNV